MSNISKEKFSTNYFKVGAHALKEMTYYFFFFIGQKYKFESIEQE